MGTPIASPATDSGRPDGGTARTSGDPIQTLVAPPPAPPTPAGPPAAGDGQADLGGIEDADDDAVLLVDGRQAGQSTSSAASRTFLN
eukprot:1597351-Alexandrium_andersonii.AAC.1